MFANVIIGVDGGRGGRDAIALAAALAPADAHVTLAHIYGASAPAPAGARPHPRSAADALDLLAAARDASGIDAELATASASSVSRGLHVLSERHGADLLVVGSHTRAGAGHIPAGDDTGASLSGAPCAVAVAPHGYEPRFGGFLRIGVAYDFSPESEAALAVARVLAQRDGAKLRACHVVGVPVWGYVAPMPVGWGELVEADREAARERVATLEGVDATAVHGLPREELAAFGARVDLLVVGSRNRGPLRRLIAGSTSHALARRASCALLIVPRTAACAGAQVSTSLRSSA
jgi:nucleotide-binding universal stress UspA family protein